MAEDWIEAVMRMNGAIVAAEARFNAQVIDLVETGTQGQDTGQAEALLQNQERRLMLLRAVQTQLLREGQNYE